MDQKIKGGIAICPSRWHQVQMRTRSFSAFPLPPASAKTLLDAVTLIQEYSIAEDKSPLPETFLTLKGQALLFGIGFFASMDSVIYSFFLVPYRHVYIPASRRKIRIHKTLRHNADGGHAACHVSPAFVARKISEMA